MAVSPLAAAAYVAATSVLWKAAMRCSSPPETSTTVASAMCVPASGPPGTCSFAFMWATIDRGVELTRVEHVVLDRAALVDRVEDLLVADPDRVGAGVQLAADVDEVAVGRELRAEGRAVGGVPGCLQALDDGLADVLGVHGRLSSIRSCLTPDKRMYIGYA